MKQLEECYAQQRIREEVYGHQPVDVCITDSSTEFQAVHRSSFGVGEFDPLVQLGQKLKLPESVLLEVMYPDLRVPGVEKYPHLANTFLDAALKSTPVLIDGTPRRIVALDMEWLFGVEAEQRGTGTAPCLTQLCTPAPKDPKAAQRPHCLLVRTHEGYPVQTAHSKEVLSALLKQLNAKGITFIGYNIGNDKRKVGQRVCFLPGTVCSQDGSIYQCSSSQELTVGPFQHCSCKTTLALRWTHTLI